MPLITLKDIMQKVDRLPPMPQAVLRVSNLLEQESANAAQMAAIIRLDPTFTSQVLRLCNSAAYGFSRRISTVKEAVAILGFSMLKSMVYTILAKAALDHPVPGYALAQGDLWQNSLTCSIYARHIAQRERLPNLELAFTGGLLRDIGKIVLGDFVGPKYAEIERAAITGRIDFLAAEDKILGFNHSTAGMHLAERWNLPPILINIIRHHHHPAKIPPTVSPLDAKVIAVIHLADALTSMMAMGTGQDGMMYCLDADFLQKAGLRSIENNGLERLIGELVDLHSVIKDLSDSLSGSEA